MARGLHAYRGFFGRENDAIRPREMGMQGNTSLQESYDELIRRSREESILTSCTALLDWDEQTYVPPQGSEHRGNQKALLAGLQHDRSIDPRVGELLDHRPLVDAMRRKYGALYKV
jgi:hypothetical protein